MKALGVLLLLVVIAAGVFALLNRDDVRAWYAQVQYRRAESAEVAGDLAKAAKGFEYFATALPADARAPQALGRAAACLGKLGLAHEQERVWGLLLAGYPDSPQALAVQAERARRLFSGGKAEEALALVERLLEAPPELVGTAAPFEAGRVLYSRGDLKGARRYLLYALRAAGTPEEAASVKALLGKVNIELIFSPMPMEGSVTYTVKEGDTLVGIALAHGTTVAQIKRSNGIQDNILRPGQRLKVLTPSYEIRIDLSDCTLTLFMNGEFLKEYPVGVGQFESTPVGEYKIVDKVENPTWYSREGVFPFGDPRNVLGTRWLGLDVPSYGIHGTWDDSSVGKASSAGCVRMYNRDVEELYDLVTKGTPVIIEP